MGPLDIVSVDNLGRRMGFAELLEQKGIVVIEWPERVEALLPPGCLKVRITPTGATRRRIDIAGRAQTNPHPTLSRVTGRGWDLRDKWRLV